MIRRNSFRLGSTANMGSHKITIRLLDDNEILQLDFQAHHKGQFLMDYVCRQLNIAEKDYFGLRYVDSNKQRHWLNLNKSISKQLKDMSPLIVCVRFKFYPSDPMLLKESVTRYQLILQLRRDMLHGRLYSNLSDMADLAAYVIQSELGDYDPQVHVGNYVAEYELVSRQTPEFEAKVVELHQGLKGTSAADSDEAFLKKSVSLDTYGVDPHPVKDQQGEQVYLGLNYSGISTFQGSKKSTHFKWSQISKLNYEAKMFIMHVCISEDSRNKKKETVGFKCQSFSACKYLWCCAVEQRLFFNCLSSNEIPNSVRGGGLFGTKFRYSGRVQKEVADDPGPLRATDGVIQRTPLYRSLQRNKTRSLQGSPLQEYGSLPRSNHSAPLHESTRIDGETGPVGSSTSLPFSSPYSPDQTTPILETLLEDSPKGDEKDESATNVGVSPVSVGSDGSGDTKDENNMETQLVNGTGQSECSKELTDTPSLIARKACLRSISEEVEADLEDRLPPKYLPLNLNSVYCDEPSSSWAISSLLSNPCSPEKEKPPFFRSQSDSTSSVSHNINVSLDQKQTNFPSSILYQNVVSSSDEVKAEETNYELSRMSFEALRNENVSLCAFSKELLPSQGPFDFESGIDTEGDSTMRDSKVDQTPFQQSTSTLVESRGRSLLRWPKRDSQEKLLSIWKIFIVSLICVLLAALIVAVLVIETNLDICERMRRIPEIEFFSGEVYMPFKKFVREKFAAVGKLFR